MEWVATFSGLRTMRIFLPDGLDSPHRNRFNSAPLQRSTQHARIAQLVEQGIENPRVGGSIPPPGTISSLPLCPKDFNYLAR